MRAKGGLCGSMLVGKAYLEEIMCEMGLVSSRGPAEEMLLRALADDGGG